MSLLEAAAPLDNRADEAARVGGTEDASVFLGRMMAEAQSGYHGWGECFHRFWLAEEESHTWAMVPEPQRQVLLEHFELSQRIHGERMASLMMRKFGIKFSVHHPAPMDVKDAFIKVKCLDDWHGVLEAHYGLSQSQDCVAAL